MTELGEYGLELAAWRRSQEATARITRTPEERVERVRMALAEAGYPDAAVAFSHTGGVNWKGGPVIPDWGTGSAPLDVWWRSLAVAGESIPCWPCFEASGPEDWSPMEDCDHDPLTSPWPEVVR